MNSDFELVLEDCLARQRAGANLEDCLALYPAQAEVLSPLLLAASRVRTISKPEARPEAIQAGRELVLAALAAKDTTHVFSNPPISKPRFSRYIERIFTILHTILFGKENKGMKFVLRLAFDMMIILVIGLGLTVNASARSLPGDSLYGVKRTWEELQLGFTLNEQARQELQTQMTEERRQEVQQLLKLRRPVIVEFEGDLQSISAEEWVIDGIRVRIQSATVFEGNPTSGMHVWIRAQIQPDGSLVAQLVRAINQPQPAFSNPGPGVTSTPGPGQTPWKTSMPGNPSWYTYEPTRMPWPTDWSTHMPQPTYMPWSTQGPRQQSGPSDNSRNDDCCDHNQKRDHNHMRDRHH